MTHGRLNVAASIPTGTGAAVVAANVILTWDDRATLSDLEEAIKAANRQAVYRVRKVFDAQ